MRMNIQVYEKDGLVCLAGEVYGKELVEQSGGPAGMRVLTIKSIGPYFQVVFQTGNTVEFNSLKEVYEFLSKNGFRQARR